MCTAQLMVILDATIVNVALPAAQSGLGFDTSDRQWVVSAYALAFGSLLLVGGRIADLIGRRKAVLIGLAGFGVASAVGGAAVDFPMLVTARALQGVFGALLAPAALAIISTTFTSAADRARAFGIYGSVSAGGGAVGLLLGGVLTEYASWRWTLFVNVALAAVGIVGALLTLAKQPKEPARAIDLAGTVTMTVGLFALVFGFSSADESGWSSIVTLACLIGGAILVLSFGIIESRAEHPVLPLRVIASRLRGGSLLVLFLGSVGLFTVSLFLTYYLQDTLGFSPLQAGLAFLPQTIAAVGASLLSGVLLCRIHGGILVAAGMAMAAGGAFWLSSISSSGSYAPVVLPALILIGGGLGLALSVALNLAVMGVLEADSGVASAAANAVQQIGGSIGPALFNTIAGAAVASFAATNVIPSGGESSADLTAPGTLYSYSVAFQLIGIVLAAGAVLGGGLIEMHRRRPAADITLTKITQNRSNA